MSKQLLAPFGFPFTSEAIVNTSVEAGDAADAMGYPVVVKLNGSNIAHKTERGLVRLQLADRSAVEQASAQLLALATVSDGKVQLLVARMINGSRELIVGMVNDPVFGKTAMLGIGGIFAEVIQDVVFAPLPIGQSRALEMIDALKYKSLLQEFRGESAVNVGALADALVAMSVACDTHNEIVSIDINPLIVQRDGSLVAVDALVEVLSTAELPTTASTKSNTQINSQFAQYDSLFSPRAIVVVGASSHPGKFGFVSLHNILSNKFAGKVYATNLAGEVILGIQTVASIDDLPMNEIDLAFFCTPASANPGLLRQCAARGIRAAFIASAGYREAGPSGEQVERDLVLLATELGMVVAGPNGQGVVSTPVSMCAQIVGPYPPRGAISVASQSGNFVSSFLNYARQTGVGIARAISAGNAAQTSVGDYLEWFSQDSETRVSLAYIESVNVASADDLQWQRLNQLLLKSGVTSWCPTLVSASRDSLAMSLAAIQSRMQQQRTEHNIVASSILGAHMEGPFLGAALGAHDRRSVVEVDLHWIAQLPACVSLMTIGPEQENGVAAVRLLRQRGIAVSLGHTRATEQQFLDAKEAGAQMVTHLFNAMSGVHHREHGVALTALTDDEIFASIIVDLEHVSRRAVQLAFRAKPQRMVLVTDSVRATTVSAPRLNDGTLAGSVLLMDQALRNTVVNCSVPLSIALMSATRNPAEVLGLHDRGDISIGKRADLVLLTHDLSVLQTVSRGLFYNHTND